MPHPTVLLLARADLSPVDTEFTTGPLMRMTRSTVAAARHLSMNRVLRLASLNWVRHSR